jgi:hypothetical protein
MENQQQLYETWKANAKFMGTEAPTQKEVTFDETCNQTQGPKAGETVRNQFLMADSVAKPRK